MVLIYCRYNGVLERLFGKTFNRYRRNILLPWTGLWDLPWERWIVHQCLDRASL